jgi:3-hydroxyisobutyrate dehydrogenase
MTTRSTAFVGCGLIGSGLAEAALARGESVVVWNRTRAKCAPLEAAGARVADTPADAALGARRVHITMTADDAADAMIEALSGALADDAVVIDHSTTDPARTKARALRCADQGIRYLHVPVLMSPEACRQGLGVMLAAGPKTVFDAVQGELEKMTGQVWFVGEEPDRGAALKLMGNAMAVAVVGGLADVFTLGTQLGVEPTMALELFERFDPNWVVKGRGAKMARGDYATQWTARMARKDIALMQRVAAEQPLTVLDAVASRLDDLVDRGDGELDMGALSKHAIPQTTT